MLVADVKQRALWKF